MTERLADYQGLLVNIKLSKKNCNCSLHRGQLLIEIDADLIDGRPIRIQKDTHGYRVAIGWQEINAYPPPPVSAGEVLRIIQDALRYQQVALR